MKKKKTPKKTVKKIIKKPLLRQGFEGRVETKVTKLLDSAKIKYKTLEHKVVFTAYDVGATTKKKLSEIAKVVLVKADKDFVLIVLPAGKYVDFGGIKKALKAKKVSMASEKDITKYLKTKVGLLHPFGSLFKPPHPTLSREGERGLGVLLDKGMSRAKKMITSAGTYTDSIEIAVKDFEKLIKPIKGSFSKAKK